MCARFVSKDKSDGAKNCGMCTKYIDGKCVVVEQIKEEEKKKLMAKIYLSSGAVIDEVDNNIAQEIYCEWQKRFTRHKLFNLICPSKVIIVKTSEIVAITMEKEKESNA